RRARWGLPRGLLPLAPFGAVSRALREAEQGPGRIAPRIDHDFPKEAAAVLPQPPRLGFVPAFPGSRCQRFLRKSGRPVLLGVKAREMLADDLFRAVALDAGGTCVPARDVTLRVERIDRVVRHRADEGAEALFSQMLS